MIRRWVLRARAALVHHILGVDDTPHRIAWGMFLGSVIAWTPTIGFQIAIYVAVATLFRANKVSGIPILFLSNPFTAGPLYYFSWWVGALILRGGTELSPERQAAIATLGNPTGGHGSWLSAETWRGLFDGLVAIGGELWFGCLLLGVAMGIPGYLLTLWGVRAYRRRQPRIDESATIQVEAQE